MAEVVELESSILVVAPNIVIGDLPIVAATECGFFRQVGLEVKIVKKDHADNSQLEVLGRQKERLFELGEAHVYNACQWGSVMRLNLSSRNCRIVTRRASMIHMGLAVSHSSHVEVPEDLANEPVAVAERTGSHYLGYKMLAGFMSLKQIELRHIGHPPDRLCALMEGQVAGAMLMEPYLSLAEKKGARTICEAKFFGTDIFADFVSDDTIRAFVAAVGKGAAAVNANKEYYAQRLIEMEGLEGQLAVSDISLRRLRFSQPSFYSENDYSMAVQWMKEMNFVSEPLSYSSAVRRLA